MSVAIVTASDSGIGKAIAVELAGAGSDVGITWHADEAGARATADEVAAQGRRAAIRRLDLEQLPREADVIDTLADELGGLDVFVNNAGGGQSAPFLDLEWDAWRSVMNVNLDGAFVCAQRAARRMVQQRRGGRIINVTSVHEHVPLRNAAVYCAAKFGLGGLTKVMALELSEHQITVNAVAPGLIATPLTGMEDRDPQTVVRPAIPVKRPGDAHEIAALVAFLASERASYVTGASYVADGGMLLMAAVYNQET
jgi:NAD(P)-dependent dehydrogenase (short-subunit alcohol dehydrogenase family)